MATGYIDRALPTKASCMGGGSMFMRISTAFGEGAPGGALEYKFKALVTSRSKPRVRHLRGSRDIWAINGQTGLGPDHYSGRQPRNAFSWSSGRSACVAWIAKKVRDLGTPLRLLKLSGTMKKDTPEEK